MRQKIVLFITTTLLSIPVFADEYGSGITSDQQTTKEQVKTEMQARKESFNAMSTMNKQSRFSAIREKMKSRMGSQQPK